MSRTLFATQYAPKRRLLGWETSLGNIAGPNAQHGIAGLLLLLLILVSLFLHVVVHPVSVWFSLRDFFVSCWDLGCVQRAVTLDALPLLIGPGWHVWKCSTSLFLIRHVWLFSSVGC